MNGIRCNINERFDVVEIKFKNGSTIEVIKTLNESKKSATKSFEMMKWVSGGMYNSLKWHQKLRFKIYYFSSYYLDLILNKLFPYYYRNRSM